MNMYCCRFGRLTVVALESKLEAREKEIEQLNRALEKSDEHVSSLENELQLYRSQQQQQPSTCSASVQCRSSQYDERDNALSAVMSSCSDIDRHDTLCSNESCRKKLKFTADRSTN